MYQNKKCLLGLFSFSYFHFYNKNSNWIFTSQTRLFNAETSSGRIGADVTEGSCAL